MLFKFVFIHDDAFVLYCLTTYKEHESLKANLQAIELRVIQRQPLEGAQTQCV